METIHLRHELKHTITYSDYLAIRNRLKVIAKPDINVSDNGTYSIRSLYFDNIDDKALRQKIDGVNFREKFRLRYYGGKQDFIRLEKKIKINGLTGKDMALLTGEQCEQLLIGEYKWMPDTKNELILEFYAKLKYQQLKPKTIVDYNREPYVYIPGNVRITIDSNIRTGLYNKDFLNRNIPTISTGSEIILEVKYDEFLPEIIAAMVQVRDTKTEAFSKYACCRMYG